MYNISLKNIEYVSFDIYDTLIKRNVNFPTDVFDLVELKYNNIYDRKISNFKKYRIDAEQEARAKKTFEEDEITLDLIYYFLSKYLEPSICDILKNIELEIEVDITVKNNDMYDFYCKCLKEKKIIITSDMYLPIETIEKILEKNGIHMYEKLYLSSDIKKTKAKGTLFDYIISDLKISPSKILHIGDNKKSDFISPLRKGIKSKIIKRKKFNKNDDLFDNIVSNLSDNYSIKNYYYDFGFKNLGPLLVGLSKWINYNASKYDIEKIYFLSRDGCVMKNAYDILYDSNTYYIYASRRSLIVPSLWKAKDFTDLFSMMNIPKCIKLNYLLERLGLKNINSDDLRIYDLELFKEYRFDELLNNDSFINFINDQMVNIKNNSLVEYEYLKEYLNNNQFYGKLAIVDIGWFGSMQKALERLFDREFIGLYLGIHTRKNSQSKDMHGFLFENNKNLNLDNDEYLFNSIVEFIFSTFHGSVKSFDKNCKVNFYEYEYENLPEKEYLNNIQKGALDFVNIVKESGLLEILNFNENESCKNLFNSCLYPSYLDSKNLGNISILDNGINKIGSSKNIFYYFVHPIKFIKDFKKVTWKIGFLKRIFVVPLNYYKIVKYLKSKMKV